VARPEIPPGSFAFRVSCYSEFGWTPDDIPRIPLEEAERLAIYFEELGAYHYRQNKKYARGQDSGGDAWQTELELGDEEPDTWIDIEEETPTHGNG
jgi:hypothetical protein